MQRVFLHGRIGAQGEREAALWVRQTSCALDQAHPEGSQACEGPPRSTLFGRAALGLVSRHLQFAVEIVRHDGREQPSLVGGAAPAGDVIHLGFGFQLREDCLLGAAPVVQCQDLARGQCGVGQDDLELIPVFIGSEEIQLHWPLALLRLTGADEVEAARRVPALRLPIALEEAHVSIGTVPQNSPLDLLLQLSETLKGHRDRVLDAERIERANPAALEAL